MSAYERIAVWFAGSRPGAWFFVNVATRMDRLLLPLTRGRLSSCLGTSYHGSHLLLLTTTGAKSEANWTARHNILRCAKTVSKFQIAAPKWVLL